jgi:hypothetical protein
MVAVMIRRSPLMSEPTYVILAALLDGKARRMEQGAKIMMRRTIPSPGTAPA